MRWLASLAIFLLAMPAAAQLVAPLTTSDGHIACTQGETGIGRPPAWKAVADPRALGGWALAETAGDTTELHFPICISEQTVALDVDATLRFKPVSGIAARTGGLILRARNARDYYVVAANALDGSVRLSRMQNGRRAQLAAKEVAIATGQWHDLRVILVKESFKVSLDGGEVLTASDRSLGLPGTVGVWSQADSLTYFGALVVAAPRLGQCRLKLSLIAMTRPFTAMLARIRPNTRLMISMPERPSSRKIRLAAAYRPKKQMSKAPAPPS